MVNNFVITGQIQLILVPLDQKLAEPTNKNINYSKKKQENFSRLFFSKFTYSGSRPFTFYKNNFGKPSHTLPKESNGQGQRLRAPENFSQVETRLAIRPFTVRVNRQIRGLISIRKGLGKDDTPFLVSSNSIIASENVFGRVSGESLESLR